MPNNEQEPVVTLQITISCLSNNAISVSGFPNNLFQALDILATAQKAVLSHFKEHAEKGNLDNKLSVIPSPIISPDKKLVDMAGKLSMQ